MARRSFEHVAGLLSVIMRSESLDELPESPRGPERTLFLSRLLKSESLPFDDSVPAGQNVPRTSGLFLSEPLPFDDTRKPREGRRSFLATIFSSETLPADPVPGSGPVDREPGG
jgi:hypothetical protein